MYFTAGLFFNVPLLPVSLRFLQVLRQSGERPCACHAKFV